MITTQEVAEKFGLTVKTVRSYLYPARKSRSPKIDMIREYAAMNGWYSHMKKCSMCGNEFTPGSNRAEYCPECRKKTRAMTDKRCREKKRASGYWHNGCFHTRADEIKRMIDLREQGFSNAEIAKKIGRHPLTIRNAIGLQPEEMTKQNHMIGCKIYAQKNAARKQYAINKPIEDYNNAVEEVRSVAEHLERLKQDLTVKEKIAQENARRTVDAPSIVLSTTQIAG